LTPSEDALPVDPSSDVPQGYTADQRGLPGGFIGDPDIMDTWATSSLTPHVAAGWRDDPALFAKLFPMSLRPQGQDIIRTWLFSTVVRSHLEHGSLPWSDAAISGWIVDRDHKKIGKSTGNAITPTGSLEKFGADGVRYWAASAKLGTDAAFEESQMKIGRRLAIKILNASKFALSFGDSDSPVSLDPAAVTVPLDQAVLAGLATVVEQATAALEAYDHTRALEVTETFFWTFCDDYLELVKDRAYGGAGRGKNEPAGASEPIDPVGAASARTTLALALDVLLRLFAPVLPFATEEVWSWWREGSVHRQPWPEAAPLRAAAGDVSPGIVSAAGQALAALRKVKSEAKVSMRTEVSTASLGVPATIADDVRAALADVRSAGRVTGDLDLYPVTDDDAVVANAELVVS
ncbi:MAG: valine--tRNA ligase, partial [Cellulomonas sp.]|nr:valine--tRNA ligase [Cellulomonas sp.]